jgi:hypothetical protein
LPSNYNCDNKEHIETNNSDGFKKQLTHNEKLKRGGDELLEKDLNMSSMSLKEEEQYSSSPD